ncbi:MAG: hypothetical protein U1E27_07170, partial [Kiritimatiellia bacterium]|nr:hypothetical protein [Kiritimatiellia bacterium]
DAIAHPFFVMALQTGGDPQMKLPFMLQILNEMRPKRLDWMLDRLAEDHIALEISPRLTYLPVFQEFMAGLYRKARTKDIRFLLGSDSHRLITVGQYDKLLGFVQSIGIGPEDLWHPEMSRNRKT